MGHQLLLCASIPHKKYTQTVSALQALTGLGSPQSISTYTIITKPHNVFKPKVEAGKVNQIEQYYMKCLTTWDDDASRDLDLSLPIVGGKPEIKVARLFTGEKVKHWTFHLSDIPTAGKSPVLAQNFYESTMVHHHSQGVTKPTTNIKAEATTNAIDDKKIDEIYETDANGADSLADELLGNNDDLMVIDVPAKNEEPTSNALEGQGAGAPDSKEALAAKEGKSKSPENPEQKDSFLVFLEDLGYDVINQYWLKGIRFFHGDIVIEIFKVLVRDDNERAKGADDPRIPLKLLDETNTFQIKTYITFPKGTSIDLISKGSKDLLHLKGVLQNLFELEVPDRMFMDSRVARAT